jgi:hypothetical protein
MLAEEPGAAISFEARAVVYTKTTKETKRSLSTAFVSFVSLC